MTMYAAAHSLAMNMCRYPEKSFDEIWETWSEKVPEELRPALMEMGKALAGTGREYIQKVPEEDYRRRVTAAFGPEIEKEEANGEEKERSGAVQPE